MHRRPVGDPAETLRFIQDRWADLSALMSVRSTRTTNLVPPATASSNAYFVVGIGGVDAAAVSHPHGRWLVWQASH